MKDLADRRFTGLLEAGPDALICVGQTGQIAFANAQAERLFGYDKAELMGQSAQMLVPGSAKQFQAAGQAADAADPRPRPASIELGLAGHRKDGSTFPTIISVSYAGTEQGPLVAVTIKDVTDRLEAYAERARLRTQTERDRLERQLQQSHRLESLGQLAGGVAHDFNNLLGVISSYADLVAEEVEKQAPPGCWKAVRTDIHQVQRAAERAAELTHQLLSFARRKVIQPRVLNLNEVVASVRQLLHRTLGEHVGLVTKLGDDLSLVLADPGQIEQVLINLAVNGRDAMPGGGTLTIETSDVHVDEEYLASQAGLPPGRYVTVKVSDTGTGMSPDVVDRAFEPFYTTKPKSQGSGLGLATVYGIITQAGGDVYINSEPGLGTTLTVLLPVTDKSPAGAVPSQGKPERGAGQTVLVVEDESALREVTRRILARSGYRVMVAASGQEAIDISAGSPDPIEVLLTDVVMPQMQGKEVAEHVRALQPGIRVLFMSGYTQGLLGAQGVLEPGISLIEKPFSQATLLAKIRDTLSPPA